MKSTKHLLPVLVSVMCLMLAACGAGKKLAATTALQAAEDAYNAAKVELVKYIPDEAKGVEDAIASAKENLSQNKFDEVLTAVKVLPDKVKELIALAETKKIELTKSWEEMSAGMPTMLEEIKSKLDALSAGRKLPAGMDKATLDGAKGAYETASTMWTEAQTAFSAGDVADAMTKANTVKEKVVEAMTALGMQPPVATTTATN